MNLASGIEQPTLCSADNVSLDAAVISQAVGASARVQYSRADEYQWENYGSPHVWALAGAVDGSGGRAKVAAWNARRGRRRAVVVPARRQTFRGIVIGFPEPPLPASSPPVPPARC